LKNHSNTGTLQTHHTQMVGKHMHIANTWYKCREKHVLRLDMVQYPFFSFPCVYLLPSGYGWVLAFHCRTLPLKQLGESNISPTLRRDPKRKQRHHFEGFEHSVRQWLPKKILVFQFFWNKNVKWVDSLLVGRNQRSEMINSDSQIWKKTAGSTRITFCTTLIRSAGYRVSVPMTDEAQLIWLFHISAQHEMHRINQNHIATPYFHMLLVSNVSIYLVGAINSQE
jgi:hypothetical protein